MVSLAVKYQEKLKGLFTTTIFDEKYMFYNGCSYYDEYKSADTTWNKHEFVSIDSKGNVLGYIKYSIDRDSRNCNNLQIVNFSDNRITFGIDTMTILDEIFTKFKFNKLSYCVVVGNPIEKTYDKLTSKYGGRIVGFKESDVMLMDGKYYDMKMYEILKDNYKKRRR